VIDDALVRSHASPNRIAFLLESLADLRSSRRDRGGDLVVRRGDPVAETMQLAEAFGSTSLFVSEDSSPHAVARENRLARACRSAGLELRLDDATAVVPAGLVTPDGSDHYRVFTPYWRRWREVCPPAVARAPGRVQLPEGVDPGEIPSLRALTNGTPSRAHARGGEKAGRRRLTSSLAVGLPRYARERDRLATQPVPPLRLPLGARDRGARPAPDGRRVLRSPALLARLLPAAARRQSADDAGGLPSQHRPVAPRR
jgi:deoxyribodipyrimidine photo-lyase